MTDPEPGDAQLGFFEQLDISPQAEYVEPTSSAFFIDQNSIDHILRLGSNTHRHRERIVAAFEEQKSTAEIADILKNLYHGGNGIGGVTAWYTEDGIRLSHGKTARYDKAAQVVSWETAAERIGQLLENGQFATNVELVEALGYERTLLAQQLWYLYHDFSNAANDSGYLPSLAKNPARGFPEESAWLAEQLDSPEFRQSLAEEYAAFQSAYRENSNLLRLHHHKLQEISDNLHDLSLPRTAFSSAMTEIPMPQQFITEDEIDAAMSSGSGIAGGKDRIFAFFQEKHTEKEKVDFLRQEYGIGGHSHALSGAMGSSEDHSGKGMRYKKDGCLEVRFTWEAVSRRITELIRQDRYLTREEQAEYDKIQAEKALADAPDITVINPRPEYLPIVDALGGEVIVAPTDKPTSPTLLRYTIRLLPNEGGITGIWDAALNRFYMEDGQILRFAEQDNAIAYLAGIQKSPNIEQAGPFFSTPLGNVYRVGDRVSEVDPDDPSPYVMDITQVTEDQVWFTIINVPEHSPTTVDRTSFERYLDTGYYSLVEDTEIIRNPGRRNSRYEVVVYHPFENGFDEKLDYPTLEEAVRDAQKYLDGSMEPDGFAYDGAAIYDLQEKRYLQIYGNFPDEKAQMQVRAQQEAIDLQMELEMEETQRVVEKQTVINSLSEQEQTTVRAMETAGFLFDPGRANPGMGENLVFTAGQYGYPVTFETWEQAYEWIDNAQLLDTPGLREQVQAVLHPTPGEVIPTDAEYAQANLVPGETEFEQDGRRYRVHSIDIAMGKVELTDLTFVQSAGFPIMRIENIGTIRAYLESPRLTEPPKHSIWPSKCSLSGGFPLRPPFEKEFVMRKRPIKISVRLTESERVHLSCQAQLAGLSGEEFVRQAVAGVQLRPKPPDQISALLRELHAIGNNVNQMARLANARKYVPTGELAQIEKLLDDLWCKIKDW